MYSHIAGRNMLFSCFGKKKIETWFWIKFKTSNLVLTSDVLWDYPNSLYEQNKLFSSRWFLFWRFCISSCRKRTTFDKALISTSLSVSPQNLSWHHQEQPNFLTKALCRIRTLRMNTGDGKRLRIFVSSC